MNRKTNSIGAVILVVCIVLNIFNIPIANAAADYEVKYETQSDLKCGFKGKITVKNNSSTDIDQWKLEFDWDRNITRICNAKIESRVKNHYVLSFVKHNELIPIGKSITIEVIGSNGSIKQDPSNFVVTDIYDKLSQEDIAWQQYSGIKAAEEFQKSFVHGFCYMLAKFPVDEPHRIGYEIIEKNPVKKYIDAKYQNVEIPTKDGLKLKSLFFPVKKAKGTVIMLHGSGSTAIWETAKLKYLLDNGYQLLSYNSRYWNFWNEPEKYIESLTNEVKDVDCAVNYLKTRRDVNKNKIGIYGFSYGAIKSEIYAHMKNDVKVFVFDGASASTPTYTPGITWEIIAYDVAKITKEIYGDDQSIYENLDYESPFISSIAQLTKPALFIHGIKDTIPQDDVYSLYNAASGPKEMYIFPNSGHCDAMYTSDKVNYENKVVNFLDKYLK